jgi:hypothetical protein
MSKLDACLPKSGLLKDYLDFATPLTDAPLVYHLFCGLVTIAVSLGNRVYLPFGAVNIYPNLYVCLLGSSSFCRKTYSMSIARNILENFDGTFILAEEFSPERLFERLSKTPQGLILWSEFGGALQNFERSYMLGTKEFLTDLFDCRPKYRRELKNTEYVIENPCVSILAASTASWLSSRIKEDDVRGGFFPRFLFIPETKKDKRLDIPPLPDKQLQDSIARDLARLRRLSGRVTLDRVRAGYREWIFGHEDQLKGQSKAGVLGGFWTRLSIYTLKFAMLYQVSMDGSLEITSEAMSKAIYLTEFLKTSLVKLFDYEFQFTKAGKDKVKVLQLIEREPGIVHGRLLQNSNLKAKELKEVLDTLFQEERIHAESVNKKKCYYPKKEEELVELVVS